MKLKNLFVSTAIASFLALPVTAQETATEADTETATMDETMDLPMTIEEMTVDQFIGLNVLSNDGDDVGEIDYVIGGMGSEAQAIIGVGGFLGMGEYTVALPISAFDFDAENRDLIVGMTEDELRATPEVDESGLESVDGERLMADLMGDGATGDATMETDTDTGAAIETDADADSDADTDATMETDSGDENDASMEDEATEDSDSGN